MGKLQPNYSWQKYEGKPEDQKEQFQYQLQNQHVQVANSVNATIDDLSFTTVKERQTSFAWVDNRPIWKKTLATVAWTVGGTVNAIPLGITGNFTVIYMQCCISDGVLSSSNTLLLPHLDVTVAANSISIVRNGNNVVLSSGGANRSGFSGYLTVYYVKG